MILVLPEICVLKTYMPLVNLWFSSSHVHIAVTSALASQLRIFLYSNVLLRKFYCGFHAWRATALQLLYYHFPSS